MPDKTEPTVFQDIAARAVIGAVMLLVATGLLGIRYATLSGMLAAKTWRRTPCRIERSEFVTSQDGEPGRYLVIEYAYELDGVRYIGDRLDMLPGSMGDDRDWERELHEKHLVGTNAFCYVNPNQPDESVLDPEHGSEGSQNLVLLATPFLAIAVVFFYSVVWSLLNQRAVRQANRRSSPGIPPAPRRLGVGQTIALLVATPKETLILWAFLVGFVIVFRLFFDGPRYLQDFFLLGEVEAAGEVLEVTGTTHRELGDVVLAYTFRYQVDENPYEAVSYGGKEVLRPGDRVTVLLAPPYPERARIQGTRRHPVAPWLVIAFPGVGCVGLTLAIVGSYVSNLKKLKLARVGVVVEAEPIGGTTKDATDPPGRYEFVVDDERFRVRRDLTSLPRTLQRCWILYDPSSPQRHLLLTMQRTAILSKPHTSWLSATLTLLPPIVCIVTMRWVWRS